MASLGVVLSSRGEPEEEAVGRMLTAAPHRGNRVTVASIGHCALGVADRPEAADASLASNSGLAVAFVGALDNAPDVVRLLKRPEQDHESPAHIVLGAWQEFGLSLPGILRGTFACVVTDGVLVWAFRDHVGLETLFYREEPAKICLASEAKQVLAGAGRTPTPDVETVEALFYGDLVDPSRCPLQGVRRLVGGTLLRSDGRTASKQPYWNPGGLLETARLTPDEAAERFRELLSQAVSRTLTGRDVVSLSGGVDSPPIAVYAARGYRRRWGNDPPPALSAVYPSFPESDETEYIELVARELAMPLHVYEPRRQGLERLRYWVELFDSPWSTWSPEGTAERCVHARQLGATTILSGEFAEQVSSIRSYLVTHLLWRGRFRSAARELRAQTQRRVGRRALAHMLLDACTPRALRARRLRTTMPELTPAWVDGERISNRNASAALPVRDRWTSTQLPFFGADATGEADVYSHALHGIRARRPWADVDLWEFFLSLPAELKFPDYRLKGFARNALRGDVPDAILDRRTKSYTNQWFETMALDYASLRRWLTNPQHRVTGVDYNKLANQLERQKMPLPHYLWAKDLAAVHAFLDLWS